MALVRSGIAGWKLCTHEYFRDDQISHFPEHRLAAFVDGCMLLARVPRLADTFLRRIQDFGD